MTAKCRCASLRCTGTGGCSASFTACVCMIAVDAAQTNRTAAYFEYPSIVAILQREIRYGIEVDFAHVTVNPLMSKPGPFAYHVGNVNVDYKPSGVSTVDVPAAPGVQKEHRLHGMVANGEYTISAGGSCEPAGRADFCGRRLVCGWGARCVPWLSVKSAPAYKIQNRCHFSTFECRTKAAGTAPPPQG